MAAHVRGCTAIDPRARRLPYYYAPGGGTPALSLPDRVPTTTHETIKAAQAKRSGGNEPCDIGRFSNSAAQTDLFDLVKRP